MKFLTSLQNKPQSTRKSFLKSVLLAISILTLIACNSLKTAVFDQYSYQKTISIKVESLNLMDKAVEPYSGFEEQARQLLLDLQKMEEYEKNKPNNEVSYAMWKVMANKDKNLIGGFFKRWKEKNKLSPLFINEAKVQVAEALDLIIRYEARKNKTNENNMLDFLSNN